jgi:hypothetical protein
MLASPVTGLAGSWPENERAPLKTRPFEISHQAPTRLEFGTRDRIPEMGLPAMFIIKGQEFVTDTQAVHGKAGPRSSQVDGWRAGLVKFRPQVRQTLPLTYTHKYGIVPRRFNT